MNQTENVSANGFYPSVRNIDLKTGESWFCCIFFAFNVLPFSKKQELKTRSALDQIYSIINRRMVYHAIFWLTLYGIMIGTSLRQGIDPAIAFYNETIQAMFFAVLVYFNLLYLIPN